MKYAVTAFFVLLAGIAAANAQTAPTPLAPPVSPTPVPAPPSPLSPILTNPGLALTPYAPRAVAPSGASVSPLNQQQMQSYRNDLIGQQRALEQQGVSPASPQYRDIQQQLNQLNSGR
ncbi:MAG TPA: hypothetical protein VHU15_09615 [Stellaceae bacterium]|jgi:hypothetical protein|nr:hypothetical protein [Stellaceae bacterium]